MKRKGSGEGPDGADSDHTKSGISGRGDDFFAAEKKTMSYIPYGANVGGRQFRGAWKPYGYNLAPPTSQYKQVNPMWGLGGAAIGFGSTIARNWGTISAAGAAIAGSAAVRGVVGGVVGGALGGPPGAIEGAAMGIL